MEHTVRRKRNFISAGTSTALEKCKFKAPEGYTLVGWNTEADGSGLSYKDGSKQKFTSNVSLYAIWTTSCTVTFNANGGSGDNVTQEFNVGVEQALNANKFERTGYIFAGWNTQTDGNGLSYLQSEQA